MTMRWPRSASIAAKRSFDVEAAVGGLSGFDQDHASGLRGGGEDRGVGAQEGLGREVGEAGLRAADLRGVAGGIGHEGGDDGIDIRRAGGE